MFKKYTDDIRLYMCPKCRYAFSLGLFKWISLLFARADQQKIKCPRCSAVVSPMSKQRYCK